MKGSITIEGDINSIFNIIFQFKIIPNGRINKLLKEEKELYKKQLKLNNSTANTIIEVYSNAFDTAYLVPNSNVEFLSPAGWSGDLDNGNLVKLVVKAKLKKKTEIIIRGIVGSTCKYDQTGMFNCGIINMFNSAIIYKDSLKSFIDSTIAKEKVDTLINGIIIKKMNKTDKAPNKK